jgi:ATP-GRASP peptide maturase of grasp-with-spasm system
MILIISHNSLDYPTEIVFDWIRHFGIECQRINGSDLINDWSFDIHLNTFGPLHLQSPNIDLLNVTAVWMRRWMRPDEFNEIDAMSLQKSHSSDGVQDHILSQLATDINQQLRDEFKGLSHYFFEILKGKPTLGNSFYSAKDPNKATQLLIAKECGLKIPDTLITRSRSSLLSFVRNHHKVICKNIYEINFFHFNGSFASYTSLITEEAIEQLPESFYPSLFQEFIDKEFEVRVFYLDANLYSMAIFSSNDNKTEIDFRQYNEFKPNRNIPLQLPAEVEEKIKTFMDKCNLHTGSLDLIYTKTGEFVFLEVNPGGQFGMVSSPCNYNLEKIVAEYLIKISKNEQTN